MLSENLFCLKRLNAVSNFLAERCKLTALKAAFSNKSLTGKVVQLLKFLI